MRHPVGSAVERETLARLGILDAICGADQGFASENPATGKVLAHVRRATGADFQAALDAARAAFPRWRDVPAPRRGAMVRALGEALRRHKDALGTLIALETGKIKAEGDGEVQEMIDIADFAVGLSRQLYGRTMASERLRHRMYEQWLPLGPVGVITAFNFPAAVWAWNALIAAVCGDSVVWKPSPKAPLTALAVHRLACAAAQQHDADGIFGLLLADGQETGRAMVADARLPLISFTGSSAVGRDVAQAVAGRFGRCLLECSGNNAVIVDETADLDLALRAILFGAVGTAGQRCTTTRRLLLQETVYDEFVARLVAAYGEVCVGDPLLASTLMGPLIDEAARSAFVAAVAEAEACGGQVLYGGRLLAGPGWFVRPTLVAAENHWPVVQRETFAPILYVMRWRDFGTALALNNAVPQGLSSALFSRDLRRAEAFLAAAGSDCGIANLNLGTSGAEIGGAFGGEKDSGGGREAGSDAWRAYMRRQTVTINWGADLPLAQGIEFLPRSES
ncbi:MAG: aldehyde dehydrogenase family protein [Rhodocyclales bacterium]|nr:aldehyde dehydrogenase family protein [Rhodocyclales bacterium]